MESSSTLLYFDDYQTALPNKQRDSPLIEASPTVSQKGQRIKFYKALAISQSRKRWSIIYSLFLHMQHQSTTMTCHFQKLTIVRVFPETAVQANKITLNEALFRKIVHQGNEY
jgi:hypothetical protein